MSPVPASFPPGDAPAGGRLAGPACAAASIAGFDSQQMESLAQVAGGIAPALSAAILQEHGYRVLQAVSGQDAMEVWKWHGPRVRLLLTDMVLEDQMTGLELAAKLRTESPGLKVICTSGHRRDDMKRFPEPAGGYHYLQKPCRPQALVAAVRALLDDKQP